MNKSNEKIEPIEQLRIDAMDALKKYIESRRSNGNNSMLPHYFFYLFGFPAGGDQFDSKMELYQKAIVAFLSAIATEGDLMELLKEYLRQPRYDDLLDCLQNLSGILCEMPQDLWAMADLKLQKYDCQVSGEEEDREDYRSDILMYNALAQLSNH